MDDDEIVFHVSDEALIMLKEDENWKQHTASVEPPLPATEQRMFYFMYK